MARFPPSEREAEDCEANAGAGRERGSIALANGVNANQVFHWKGQYERGELQPRRSKSSGALVPVTIAAEPEAPKVVETSIPAPALSSACSVTIEFPRRALLSIEGAADPAVIRAVLESLAP